MAPRIKKMEKIKTILIPLLKLPVIPAAICSLVLIAAIAIAVSLMKRNHWKKRIQRYGNAFAAAFEGNGSIPGAMQEVAGQYKKGSGERDALEAGLIYLEMSMFKDYRSALGYVEDFFDDSAINGLHSRCIEKVQEQRALRLCGPSGAKPVKERRAGDIPAQA